MEKCFMASETDDSHLCISNIVAILRHSRLARNIPPPYLREHRTPRSLCRNVHLWSCRRYLCRNSSYDVHATHHETSHNPITDDCSLPCSPYGECGEPKDGLLVLEDVCIENRDGFSLCRNHEYPSPRNNGDVPLHGSTGGGILARDACRVRTLSAEDVGDGGADYLLPYGCAAIPRCLQSPSPSLSPTLSSHEALRTYRACGIYVARGKCHWHQLWLGSDVRTGGNRSYHT